MDKRNKPVKWKIRRGVNLSPLLPPFMWLKSRPPQDVPKGSTSISEANENFTDETSPGSLNNFEANSLPHARPSIDSYSKKSELNEDFGDKNISEKSKSILTSECGIFEETRNEESVDPMISHVLFIPYHQLPPARYYKGDVTNIKYNPVILRKRSDSPVRHLLPGKFDLAEWENKIMEFSKKRQPMEILGEAETWPPSELMEHRPHENSYENTGRNSPLTRMVIHDKIALADAGKTLGIEIEDFN